MLKDNYNPISNIPNPSIEKGVITKKLIEFIEKTLLKFQNQFKGKIDASEEELNQNLVNTFAYFSKNIPFIFQQEVIQKQKKGQNRKVDIGVFRHYADSSPFFTLEAKRLTTTLSKSREKEYVIGSNPLKLSGGIERFKHNVHGVNLSNSAIVGYLQRENSNYWSDKINDWINQLISGKLKSVLKWNKDELLNNYCYFKDDRLSKFSSNHIKTDKSFITLNHYFVDLSI
ncbi:hypothetical protein [uncultured Polaribacter sp.]|uniref:hypothetical protein n=1 Tax=uncultured Polaribacter sp. TaxID=174711 RepID=UPI002629E508|nr:hypothetical protein [uncultured Polaribacter sp.]